MGNLFMLTGKTALVVGGAGGIGGAIAKGLADHGATVAITGRNLERLEEHAKKVKQDIGKEMVCYQADVSDEVSVKALSEKLSADMGGIDILVNSQGLNAKFPAFEHPMEEWDKMYDVNVRSVMLTCKYFGKMMMERGGGRIINVSSIGAVRNKPEDISACYCSTKGAVNTLTANLAAGWAQHNITVNAIGPIMTETEMMKPIFEKYPELRDDTAARVPMGRIAKPEDCVGPAVFFASDAAPFITGQIIYPDGGLLTLQ
jgi:gluconate 5-dehydrogenase